MTSWKTTMFAAVTAMLCAGCSNDASKDPDDNETLLLLQFNSVTGPFRVRV